VDVTNGNTAIAGTLGVTGATALSSTLTVTGTSTMNGATTINNTLTQTGAGNQVTFAGNVDANNGFDVTGALSQTSGNVSLDVTGNTMTVAGLPATGTFTDDVLLISTGTNIVKRRSMGDLIGAEYGLTYNEANNGKVRLGAATAVGQELGADRYVNMGTNDLYFTTGNGIANGTTVMKIDGGAANAYGLTVNAGAAGSIALNGSTAITGATTITGTTNINTLAGATTNIGTGGGTVTIKGTVNINTTAGETTNIGILGGTNNINGTTNQTGAFTQTNGNVSIGGATTLSNSSIKMTALGNSAAADELVSIDATGALRKGSATTILNDDVWLLDGNTTGGTKTLGSNDNQDIAFETNGIARLTIGASGQIIQNGAHQVTFTGNINANGGLDVVGTTDLTGSLEQSGGTVDLQNGELSILLDAGIASLGFDDVNTNSMSFYNGTSAEMATNAKTGAMSSSSVKTESDGDVSLTSTYGSPITATASTVLASGATGSSITTTAGTITQNAATINLNGATTISNTLTQTGAGNQVTFAGNVDANNGLDVAGANLTVGGNKFTVDVTNGNTAIAGTLGVTGTTTLNGAVNVGNGGDAVVVDVSSSTLTVNGLNTAAGSDLVMINGSNVITRAPLTSLIGANEGLTYDENASGKMRLGSDTRAGASATGTTVNRYVNVGNNNQLIFTTNAGLADVVTINGSAANYGVKLNALGTGLIQTSGNTLAQAPSNYTIQSGTVTGSTLNSGTELTLSNSGGSLSYKNGTLDMSVAFDPTGQSVVISSDNGPDDSYLSVSATGTTIKGTLNQVGGMLVQISGNTEFAGDVDVAKSLYVNVDRFTVDGLTGNTYVKGTLEVDGATQLDNTLTVANNTSLGGSLTVTGVTNLNGATNIGNGNGDALVVDVTGSNM
ncbi:MAG: beta strand repeat-containing protein, partial [Ignavibacteria bacterium]